MSKGKSKIWSLTDEEFKAIVLRKKTSQNIIKALGLQLAGTAYTGLKQRLMQVGLYELVAANNTELRKACLTPFKKLTNKQLLVSNRKVKGPRLKQCLASIGRQINTCEICGQTDTWNDKVLVLQVDHKNGKHCDNREENLRIVCPNCHSQTETFGVKNRTRIEKLKIHCKTCNAEITGLGNSGLCRSCAQRTRRKILDRPTIEKLKREVGLLGYCAVGRKYGVSDNAVRKWLKNGSGNCKVI